ncbi:MAG: Wzz/FepE/Etk N-terminal domain-containing protein [Saprospiraceae bacterium]|nr:Wzz/FepE/Etk N-terminal domain-containing protein [Saprospiraceae bacterium]
MANQGVDLSLTALFRLIWRNRMLLSIIGIIAIVASALVSLVMTEYYQSTVVIFPTRTNSIILNESGVKRGNISDFGEEEEAEQLLQVINSDDVQERVIRKHDLYAHYDIDPQGPHSRSRIRQKYRSNVTVKRTKYNSIDISVRDKVPTMAADVANSISEFTDSVKNRMIRERASISMSTINAEHNRLQVELDSLKAALSTLHEMGVAGEIERGSLLEAYGEAIKNMDRSTARKLDERIEVNRKFGDEYDFTRRRRDVLIDQILRFRNFKNQFIADASISIPQKFVVDRAIPADKKAWPIRWLIVVGTTFSVWLLTLLLLIFKENQISLFSDQ